METEQKSQKTAEILHFFEWGHEKTRLPARVQMQLTPEEQQIILHYRKTKASYRESVKILLDIIPPN